MNTTSLTQTAVLAVRHSLHNIRRGGQRGAVAILAVLFGVMSLVGMVSLAQSISTVLMVDPRLDLGGDARLSKPSVFLNKADVTEITDLHTQGLLADYALVETPGTLILKTTGSGRITFVQHGLGFDPDRYPLLGEIVLGEPAGANPQDVLREIGDVIVTRDVARERNLELGQDLLVTNHLGGKPRQLRVAGIAKQTPNYGGQTLFYSMDTSRMATGRDLGYTSALVLWGNDPAAAKAALKAAGWTVGLATIDAHGREIRDVFDLMLRGAGILGLLVGGIGIANTMRVLLANRKTEIAILKTLGYAQGHLIALFMTEAALMGLIGSLLGTGLGLGLSRLLVGIIQGNLTLLLPWHFDLWIVLGGPLIGVLTTMLFSMNAILRAAEVRPATLFRHLPPPRRRMRETLLRGVGMGALFILPFAALTSLIMGSLLKGIGVLLVALAGLTGFGLLLGGSMWLILRLPTFGLHRLRLARNSMRRRGLSLIFGMIALFVGVFSLGLAMTMFGSSFDYVAQRSMSLEGFNLVVFGPYNGQEESPIDHALREQDVSGIHTRLEARLDEVRRDGQAQSRSLYLLQGRDELWDVRIVEGAAWVTVPNGAYLPAESEIPQGSTIEVVNAAGNAHTLAVVGYYEASQWEDGLLPPADGVLVSRETFGQLGVDEAYVEVVGKTAVDKLTAVRDRVGTTLPEWMVLTSIDLDDLFSRALKNLLVLATVMSGLALAAGAVLIANATSLAMIDRQLEIGIFKAVGYSRQQVLSTIVLEYALIAAIASAVGVLAVEIFVFVMQYVQETAGEILHVSPWTAVSIGAVTMSMTLLTVLLAAWRPTQVRPLVMLNRGT